MLVFQKTKTINELEIEAKNQLEQLNKQKNIEMQQAINNKVQEWMRQKMSM